MLSQKLIEDLNSKIDINKMQNIQKDINDKNICPRCRKQRRIFKTINIYNKVNAHTETYRVCNYCAYYLEKHK